MASGEAELKEMIVSKAELMGNVGKDGNGSSFSNKCRIDATQHTSCATSQCRCCTCTCSLWEETNSKSTK